MPTAAKNNEVALRQNLGVTIRAEYQRALGAACNSEQLARVAVTTIWPNDKLRKCDPLSLASACVSATQLDLKIDPIIGEAYLVPYGRNAQLQVGYKGLLALARRSGEVKTIVTGVVRGGDEFEYTQVPPTMNLTPVQTPENPKKYYADDNITHAYCWAELLSGGVVVEVWPIDRVQEHARRYSKTSRPDSPWKSHLEPMARKTVLRSVIARGMIPVSTTVMAIVAREELQELEQDRERKPSSDLNEMLGFVEEAGTVEVVEEEPSFPSEATPAGSLPEDKRERMAALREMLKPLVNSSLEFDNLCIANDVDPVTLAGKCDSLWKVAKEQGLLG